MTDAEAFMYAALIWPSDRVLQVKELADAGGDYMILLDRDRSAVHILDESGTPCCHEECMRDETGS